MLPVLFSFGPITIYSFGLFLFLGFIAGLFVIWKRSREENFEEDKIFDAVIYTALLAIIGSRLVYVLFNLGAFGFNLISWINLIGKPGFSLIGAFLGALAGLIVQANKKKWDFYEFSDIVVLGANLMFVFGWFGAFLNGTGYGIETESFLGVSFNGLYDKRHPVQLYSLLLYLASFIYLWWAESKYRTFDWYSRGKGGAKPGFILYSFIILSGIFGLVTNVLSPQSAHFAGLGVGIWLWSLIFLAGLIGLYLRSGRNLQKDFQGVKRQSRGVKKREQLRQRRMRQRNIGKDILN